ncbi:CocE/NonD family hydrolase [Alteromonas sp. C1M14]|uniref:CocE/NonD family hydrolase n=1 Tax=Alteromonas sp. C1M14 TaxID=2841567 RepID=UPI001C09E4F7|nr:CocE/NonD family hydrolase [Alteromonas sp. C1M14]MBU2979346.1 CocE/NonD family hydrolase [Alteromonas sp. C1M14]
MKFRDLMFGALLALAGTSLTQAQSFKEFNEGFPETVQKMYHVPVAMGDGVKLATDIYLPDKTGKYPTLLIRDMYTNGSAASRQKYAKFATSNGYALVFQSVRGRYDSEGKWYPYFQEINDGDDTLSWIAEQSWSDGKVGMFGSSYLASVQWLAAINKNPALVAIAPAVSPGNYYRDVAYPGGAFSLLSRASWGIGLVGSRTNMSFPVDWVSGINHLPIETLAQSVGFNVQHFQDWIAHPSYDDYWKPLNLEDRATEMDVPAINIGGWFDVFLRSTIGSYTTMTEQSASSTSRNGQRLIIGPWPHGWNQSSKLGDVDFGENALIDAPAMLLDWFDYWMKGSTKPKGLKADEAPVRIFIMGENVWRDEQEWPLARTDYRPFYFHDNQTLSEKSPAKKTGTLKYDYDPADPVPTLGGNIMMPKLRGPYDQKPLDDREDILRFVTEPFTEATEFTGPISAEIYASSSAPDTDFMAKLIVVKPDGTAFNLVDGVIRARYREGFEKPKLIEPGKVYKYEIDMWATSYKLSPGDRIRVDITSSNYPRLARNLNTGAEFAKTSEMQVAHQTLHMSKEYPSKIVLPIIP